CGNRRARHDYYALLRRQSGPELSSTSTRNQPELFELFGWRIENVNLVLLLLLALPADKPRCNAANQGRFWPEMANGDSTAARQWIQCGRLEMCSATDWSYRWKPVSINARASGKNRRPADPDDVTCPLASGIVR